MKLFRPILITVGVLSALIALAIGAALLPAVQAWGVRRALAGQPGLKVEFTSLAVSPWGLQLAGARYERPGLVATVERVDLEFSAWDYLIHNRIRVDRLAASGVVVDASKFSNASPSTSAASAGAPIAAPGALARLQLPWAVVVGDVQIAGRATLPAATGRAAMVAEFQLNGGKIGPAQDGALLLKAKISDPTPAARVSALRFESRLTLRETESKTFDRAGVTLAVDAEGPQFSEGTQLTLAADMRVESAMEHYSLSVDTRRSAVAENVIKLEATAPLAGSQFSGVWSLNATEKQFEPFFMGAAMPGFHAVGQGGFKIDLAARSAALQGELSGDVSSLETIEPGLRSLGLVHFKTRFDLDAAAGAAQVRHLLLQISGTAPALAFESLQPISVKLAGRQLSVSATQSADPLARLDVQSLPLAWVRPFVTAVDVSGGALSGAWLIEAKADGVRLRPTAPTTLDVITVVGSGQTLLDRASISLKPTVELDGAQAVLQVSDFLLRTPAGDEIKADATAHAPLNKTDTVDLQARFSANLPKLLAPFAPIGAVRAGGEVDGTLRGKAIDVRKLSASLANGQGKGLLSFATLQPGTVDLATLRWTSTNPTGDVGRLEISSVDFAREPLIQALLPWHGVLSGGVFMLSSKEGRLSAHPAAPVRITGLTIPGSDGRNVVENVNVSAYPSLDFGNLADWKVQTGDVTVANPDQSQLLTSTVEAKNSATEGLRVAAVFNTDFAALAKQPAFAAMRQLATGKASGEIRAARVPGAAQIEGRVTLNNFVLRDSTLPLPVANLSFRVLREATGRISVEVPILLDRLGQRSDLKLTAEAVRKDDGLFFDAKVTGEHFELADAIALAGLGGAGDETASKPVATQPTSTPKTAGRADTRPFWSGLRGELSLDVKNITRGKDWTVAGFGGYVTIEGDRISLQRVQGMINDKSRLGARAELHFGGGAMPYRLSGNFSLTDFDVGAAMKAFDGGKSPVIEGVFTVAGGFMGDGANLEQTHERTRGQFQLTSRQGVFRGLKRSTEKVSVATKTVDAVAALGSLFGGDKIKGMAEKVAGSSYQVDQLAQALAEIQFDQLVVRAERDDTLNMRVTEFTLLAPELRLIGQGSVTHVADKPLLDQPLSISYQLAARGKTEQLLGKLRMLDGSKDDLGYSKMKDLGTITGTLNRPDPSAIFVKLAQSKLIDFLN